MTEDTDTIGTSQNTTAETIDPLQLHLPKKTVYIRRLDERDEDHEHYLPGLFGAFDLDGDMLAAAWGANDLFAEAVEGGYFPFYVQ